MPTPNELADKIKGVLDKIYAGMWCPHCNVQVATHIVRNAGRTAWKCCLCLRELDCDCDDEDSPDA